MKRNNKIERGGEIGSGSLLNGERLNYDYCVKIKLLCLP